LSKKYIGIDIGTYNIKIADINVTKDMVILDNPVIVKTPKYFIQGGRIADKEEFVALIKGALAGRKLKSRKALVILNDTVVITRDMEMPVASPKELEQMVKIDASEYLSGDVNDYTIRHRVLIPSKRNPKNLNYIMMASIKNDLSTDVYETLCKAGLKPAAIDVSINSMIKYLKQFWNEFSKKNQEVETIALIDFGAMSAKLVILQDGSPVFQQVMNHSSQKIDVMIANSLDIERDLAENYKIKYGLRFLASEDEDALLKSTGTIIINQVDLMLNDIYKHLNNYMDRTLSKPVKRIWITGGMAKLEGLSYYIQEAFSIPCSIVQISETVKLRTKNKRESFGSLELFDQFPLFTNIAGAASRGDL